MSFEEFKIIWLSLPEDEETKNYIPDDKDRYIDIGGYLFVLQQTGNVIFRKVRKTKFTIRDVFRGFRIWLIQNKVKYVRVEGTKKRYNFLKRMFPNISILKDDTETQRNVFYLRMY